MFALSPFAFPSIAVPSGGGGTDLDPLDFLHIDPALDTFTDLEPDAMAFKSIVTDAGTGVTTYTFDALSPGDQKYNFTGSDCQWPRRYQLLKGNDGATLTTADSFIMAIKLSLYSSTVPSSADLRFGVGLCVDPTALTVGAFDGYGVTLRTRSANVVAGAVKFDASSGSNTNYANTTTTTAYGYIVRSKRRLSTLFVQGEVSGDTPSNAIVTSSSTTELAATTNLSLWVGAGLQLNAGTIADGQSFAVRSDYQIIRVR